MNFIVEGVQKGNEYKYFKKRIEAISGRVNIKYDYNKKVVIIGYEDPYLVDNETIKHKANTKNEILKEISVLRQVQFTTN